MCLAEIVVIGMGYVGLTSAVGLANLGHSVLGIDINSSRIASLQSGKIPIHEPGMQELMIEMVASGRLKFSDSYNNLEDSVEFAFICVSTPSSPSGEADLTYVHTAVTTLIPILPPTAVLVMKSTVPVGTCQSVSQRLVGTGLSVVSNPEFLAEGRALADFENPSRIVVGCDVAASGDKVMNLYDGVDSPRMVCDLNSAELIKLASNAFLAIKLSYVNEITELCEKVEADASYVLKGMSLDSRIGSKFLVPGPGWGGSCFPKDTLALASISQINGSPNAVLEAAIQSNIKTFSGVVRRIRSLLDGSLSGKRIAVWGLAFKANTDDTRDSPSVEVIQRLLSEGSQVTAYDPKASAPTLSGLMQASSALEAVTKADALLVLTEWAEFADIEPKQVAGLMQGTAVLDTRGILPEDKWVSEFDSFSVLGKSQK
jgi:UDPglucose 6-dehydrogenase